MCETRVNFTVSVAVSRSLRGKYADKRWSQILSKCLLLPLYCFLLPPPSSQTDPSRINAILCYLIPPPPAAASERGLWEVWGQGARGARDG